MALELGWSKSHARNKHYLKSLHDYERWLGYELD